MRRRWIFVWIAIAAVAVLLVGGTVYLPYYSLGPGPARAVEPLIRFDERQRYESDGSFVLTSVRIDRLTAFGVLGAWLDPAVTVVEREAVYPSGESDRQEQERAISQMDQSKLDAAAVVLGQLTDYPREHGRGVLVESVVPGCAADGKLFVGDVIEAIDGVAVDTMRDARRVIRAAPSGTSLRFDVTVDGEPERVSLVREPCGGESEPLVGISMIASFPFEVTISSGAIGGPSAGLAWALGFYDLLTPGDLTDGRTIATTGALGADGTVYPIGGVEEKVVAAERAGASVLLVPERNLAAAQAVGADGLEIVGVGSFHDALAQLEDD